MRGFAKAALSPLARIAVILALLSAAVTARAASYADIPWVLDGSAVWGQTGNVLLTQNQATVAGAMWDPCPIDLTYSFNLTWTIFLGDVNYNCGGDGMAFVLQDSGTSVIGTDSGEHGYSNGSIGNSLAVILDTYQSPGAPYLDPTYESLGMEVNSSDVDAACAGTNGITGPCRPPILPGGAVASDSNFHVFQVLWTPSGGNATLEAIVDGNISTWTIPNYAQYFSTPTASYFGFTASSGAAVNWQQAGLDTGSTVDSGTLVTALSCGVNTPTPNINPSVQPTYNNCNMTPIPSVTGGITNTPTLSPTPIPTACGASPGFVQSSVLLNGCAGSGNPTSYLYTVPAVPGGLLLAQVESTGPVLSGVTWKGASMTALPSDSAVAVAGGGEIYTYYLVNPAPGNSYYLTFNVSSGCSWNAVATLYQNVNVAAPIGAINTSTGNAVTYYDSLTTTSANSIIHDFLAYPSGPFTFSGMNGTQLFPAGTSGCCDDVFGSYLATTAPGFYTLDYPSSAGAQNWTGVSVELQAAAACGSPTPTPSVTPTATPTSTPTATPTHTASGTAGTPSVTPTDTPTPTPTGTPGTPSVTPTDTPTHTPSASPTATPSATETATPTDTPTITPTNSTSPTMGTPSQTPSATPSFTAAGTSTATDTETIEPTFTPTITPTGTAVGPAPTWSPTQTRTTSPTFVVPTPLPGSCAGNYLAQWGAQGTGNGQFTKPVAVAVGPTGNIYVTDVYRVQVFSAAGAYLSQFGSAGTGNGQFAGTYGLNGIAVMPAGNVYVSDTYNNRVEEFTAAGAYVSQFGSLGSGAGQFTQPGGIAVAPNGNLYVVDFDDYRVEEFTAAGVYITQWGSYGSGNGQFMAPNSVAVASNGNVYVSDVGSDRIQEFTAAGVYITQWGGMGSGPGEFGGTTGLALDATGNLYVADMNNERIQELSPSGTYMTQFGTFGSGNGQFNEPMGVAVDASGDVYVADFFNYRVEEFGCGGSPPVSTPTPTASFTPLATLPAGAWTGTATPTTALTPPVFTPTPIATPVPTLTGSCPANFLLQWGLAGTGIGQFYDPTNITVGSTGNVYVADTNNDRVEEFTSSGAYITQWGSEGTGNGQFNGPEGIVATATGNVYVADAGNNRVEEFSSTGAYIRQWGSSGSGNGQFNIPFGLVTTASGNVYVVDEGNNRIEEFSSTGAYLNKWGTSGSGNGQLSGPTCVAVSASGNFYVADSGNNRIEEFNANGIYFSQWGGAGTDAGQFNYPCGLALDGNGNVYVADAYNSRIQEFTASGTFMTVWGAFGIGDNPGLFASPAGVAIDASGDVYVVDLLNYRVEKFGCGGSAPLATPTPTIALAGKHGIPIGGQRLYVLPNFFKGGLVDAQINVQANANGKAKILIMSSRGRIIRDLWEGSLEAGQVMSISWDGRNDAGEDLASGVYYVVFEDGGGSHQVEKVLIVR